MGANLNKNSKGIEMRNKQVKLIYFSLGGSEQKQVSFGWRKVVSYSALLFLGFFLITTIFLSITTDVFHDWRVSNLSRSNQRLHELLSDMTFQVQSIEEKVQKLEKQDDDLRVFVDMPPINNDVKQLGVGGQTYNLPLDPNSGITNPNEEAIKIRRLLDNLLQRLELAMESRQEITKQYYENLRKLKQTPSIRPIWGGRVTDKFGYRLDPFIDRFLHHDGIDFSAPRGTDIYASADGVVSEIVTRYRPNHSYGKYVIIDHGFGVKTRYAHLETILIKLGQTITRHTIIGKVGDTGKSTGPHLHYEVMVEGKPTDPERFILD